MVLPTRWTRSIRLPVRVSMISSGGDLKVWGLLLVLYADDCLAVDAGVDAVGNGFDFGEFGHALSSIGGWAFV